MTSPLKPHPAAKYPISTTAPFRPNKLMYFKFESISQKEISIIDLTASLLPDLERSGLSDDLTKLLTSAELLVSSSLKPFLTIHRTGTLSSKCTIKSSSGSEVAELSGGWLTLGHTTLSFAPGSEHSGHTIEIRPASFGSRQDYFVQDSIPYFWDVEDGHKVCKLYKAAEGERREVGRFVAKHKNKDGLLMFDGEKVDELVSCATCVTVLTRTDSFRA